MLRQQFRKDTTGTLEFYPPELAVPSSATVTLYYPAGSGSVLQASAAGTVDSASTTISAASFGASSVTVASATGISAGKRYLISDGQHTISALCRAVSGTTVFLAQELPKAFANASTFKGYRITYSLTTTHTDVADNGYQARWQYTVNGAVVYHVESFDVVSAPEADSYATTLDDLVALYPSVLLHLTTADRDGLELLRASWRYMLLPRLEAKEMRMERIRDKRHLIPAHCACAWELVARDKATGRDPDLQEQYLQAKQDAEGVLATITSSVPWYDSDDDLAVDSGEERVSRASMILTR